METYDYIIAGAGLSGLTLAYNIISSPLKNVSILILDKDKKSLCNKTISFWADKQTFFDEIIYKKWNKVKFISKDLNVTLELNKYKYNTLRGKDICDFIWNKLDKIKNVKFIEDKVINIKQDSNFGIVECEKNNYYAKYIFDSTFINNTSDFTLNYTKLNQHFIGLEIEIEKVYKTLIYPIFMDLSCNQHDFTFFYVLPFSDNKFFVEIVSFEKVTKAVLSNYIQQNLKIENYKIIREEFGVTQLSNIKFKRQIDKHIINIGIKGGMVKPSTGYSFKRIEEDSNLIVQSLLKNDLKLQFLNSNIIFKFFDEVMLEIFNKHKKGINHIFIKMFRKNNIDDIFNFLDEKSNIFEIFKLAYSICNTILLKISIILLFRKLKNLATMPLKAF
jgi:lycopene beta-cyclase